MSNSAVDMAIADDLYSDGTLSDSSGELFIKPATIAESTFYEESVADHPDFAFFMPAFMGTLSLATNQSATFDEQSASLIADHLPLPAKSTHAPIPKPHTKIKTDQAIVLENAAHGYKKPNILDVKLGTRLWADDATEEKKIRFDKVTAQTTHKNLGFRIAGMRVWQGENLVKGEQASDDGYRVFDKDYGKTEIDDHNVHTAFRHFFFTKSAGIDQELGDLVVQAFLADLESLLEIMEVQESRMYSASLLFVFEGDGVALRTAMEEASKSPLVEEASDTADVEDENEDEDEDTEDKSPKIYDLKLIDFAHAKWTPGTGPDENSLHGVRNVKKILEGLISSGEDETSNGCI